MISFRVSGWRVVTEVGLGESSLSIDSSKSSLGVRPRLRRRVRLWSVTVLRLRKQGGKKQPEDDLRLTAETHPLSVAYEVSCRVRAERAALSSR
jgi:hypothetical protein